MKRIFFLLIFLLFSFGAVIDAQSIKLNQPDEGGLAYVCFELTEDTEVTINGVGAKFGKRYSEPTFLPWILKTTSRELVWEIPDSELEKRDGVFEFSTNKELKAGKYELYLGGASFNLFFDGSDLRSLMGEIFSDENRRFKKRDKSKIYIELEADEGLLKVLDAQTAVKELTEKSFVAFTKVKDYESLEQGFSVKSEVRVKIYGNGEGRDNKLFDLGSIYDQTNMKEVWAMEQSKSEHGGGAKKNRRFNTSVVLKPGDYRAYYFSDDSHSFQEWNEFPPYDPLMWGMILSVDPQDKDKIKPLEELVEAEPIIEFKKVWDDEFITKGIRLEKDTQLKIFCLGEAGHQDMADYGWIYNADTRERVWEMSTKNSVPGGGASKNRKFEGVITLRKGNYIVAYKTDDSHSYEDWNDTPPFRKEMWGITIWAINPGEKSQFTVFNPSDYRNEKALVQIIRVRDDRKYSEIFTIDQDLDVRIYALGEGQGNELYDYGWIENAESGEDIWRMRYKETTHAGGADKNRKFNDVIRLKKGKYRLHYRTDDSHAYGDWNTRPPDDEESYGITVYKEKK